MFASLVNATLNLLLLRIGPEDFPYAPNLTRVLVPLAALVNYAVVVQALPPLLAMAMALAVVIGTGLATRALLRARQLEARFMQTFHALLVVNLVLTAGLWLPFSELAPQLRALAENPDAVNESARMEISGWAAIAMNVLNVWNFVVNAHILRRAANYGFGGGLLLAVALALAVLVAVLFFASLASILLGVGGVSSS